MVEAKVKGTIWLAAVFISWIYYTIWILVSPMIDKNHPI
jgi:hypothetical protein